MSMKHKCFTGQIKAIDEARRAIRFVISSDEIDRDNEIVTVESVKNAIPGFAKNPVSLINHQHRADSGMPTIPGSWDTETYKALAHTSEMDHIFAKTELGETCWLLCKDGHMKAVSLGFRVLDGYEEVKNGVRVFIITKIELFEISLVAVGANRRALAKSILKEFGFEPDDVVDSDQGNGSSKSLEDFKANLCQSVKSVVSEFRDEILAELEEIKDIIVTDRGDLAKELLPEGSTELAADADDAGQTLTKIATLLDKFKD